MYAPITDVKETELEWFYENLQDLLGLTSDVFFNIRGRNAKVGSQEITGTTGKFGLEIQNEAKANRVMSREYDGHSKHSFPTRRSSDLDLSHSQLPVLFLLTV